MKLDIGQSVPINLREFQELLISCKTRYSPPSSVIHIVLMSNILQYDLHELGVLIQLINNPDNDHNVSELLLGIAYGVTD